RDGSGVGNLPEPGRNDTEIAPGGPGIPCLHRPKPGFHSELWRALSKRRTDQHGFCRVSSESGDKKADGQEAEDATESAGKSSTVAGSNSGAQWGVGGNFPHLVSWFPATSAERRCLPPGI